MSRIAAVCLSLCIATGALARIGGGDSYSGSSSSSSSSSSSYSSSGSSSSSYGSSSSGSSDFSSSSSGPGGAGMTLVLIFGLFIFIGAMGNARIQSTRLVPLETVPVRQSGNLSKLRNYDPNFSEIVFIDFCSSLFARLHEARGQQRLAELAPYVSEAVRNELGRDDPPGLVSVDQIVVGSFRVTGFSGLDSPTVSVDVELEANYTETAGTSAQRWYTHERWVLERARDILSPTPEKARALHCPKCGAPLQSRTDGACLHCGARIVDGSFQWFLTRRLLLRKDQRAPALGGGGGAEPGLDRPSVIQPWFARVSAAFVEKNPGFTWEDFKARVRLVASELQTAWSSRDWERSRRYETNALFQTHRYWIDEYLRQGLRNIVDGYTIDDVEVVKIDRDAFYDAITVRLFASGIDYTVDDGGHLAGGSRDERRRWSEYWTMVRGRAGGTADATVCPNCGAARSSGQAVICDYCGGKITTGNFPWILSRIDQDEAYQG